MDESQESSADPQPVTQAATREADIFLVGIYRDGNKLVVVDGLSNEHEVMNAQQLWQAVQAIMNDPQIPKSKTQVNVQAEAESLIEAGYQVLEDHVRNQYGDMAGRATRAAVRSGGKSALSFLRRISR